MEAFNDKVLAQCSIPFGRRSREGGNPLCSDAKARWIPAFAGMTEGEIEAFRGFVTIGGVD